MSTSDQALLLALRAKVERLESSNKKLKMFEPYDFAQGSTRAGKPCSACGTRDREVYRSNYDGDHMAFYPQLVTCDECRKRVCYACRWEGRTSEGVWVLTLCNDCRGAPESDDEDPWRCDRCGSGGCEYCDPGSFMWPE